MEFVVVAVGVGGVGGLTSVIQSIIIIIIIVCEEQKQDSTTKGKLSIPPPGGLSKRSEYSLSRNLSSAPVYRSPDRRMDCLLWQQ